MKNSNQIMFRVKDKALNLIGYEMFDRMIGWNYVLEAEAKMPDGSYLSHDGLIADTEFTHGREQFTGIADKTRENIFDGDILKADTGEVYVVQWNTQQSSWWIMILEWKDILDFPENLGGHRVSIHKENGMVILADNRLGDGTFRRDDLTIIGHITQPEYAKKQNHEEN